MKGNRLRRVLFFLFLLVFFFLLFRRGSYDGESRITLILGSFSGQVDDKASLAIFSIEPRKKRAIYVVIPGNTYLTVPYGYQNYRAGSIYSLGELDGKRSGGKLVSKSIENSFSLAVNGYFIGKDGLFPLITDKKETLMKVKIDYFSLTSAVGSIFNWFNILRTADTNLTSQDQFKLWWAIRGLRSDQITYVDMTNGTFLTDEILADKSLVKNINTDQFELNYATEFEDSRIRNENITLEVVNATEQALVALNFSRILEHLGATVVVLSSEKEKSSNACMIYLGKKELENRRIVIFLKELYKCKVGSAEFDSYQTDAKIVLGEDFLK